MKKSILIAGILSVLTLTTAFKNFETDKKEYLTIYYNNSVKQISVSGSDGSYKEIPFIKIKGDGDQTQLLSLIKEMEEKGYKLMQYDHGAAGASLYQSVVSVLMEK